MIQHILDTLSLYWCRHRKGPPGQSFFFFCSTEVLKLVFCQNCTILYQEVVISSKHCVSSFHINVMPATNLKKSEDLWVCLRGHSDTGSHHYLGGNWGPAGGPASKCPLLNAPSMSGDEGPGPPPWGLAVVYMDNVYLVGQLEATLAAAS